MYENKHLHNKSQGTLSISCYTSCEGLGLAKTTKNVRNCKCRGKSSGLVFLGAGVSVGVETDVFSAPYYRGISQHTTGIHVLHESQLRATLYGATLVCVRQRSSVDEGE